MKRLLLIAFFGLTGCIEYNTPICNEQNLADVPNLEGAYYTVNFDPNKFETSRPELNLKRIGKGRYETEVQGKTTAVAICQYGKNYLFENQNQEKGYELWGIQTTTNGGFQMLRYIIDRKALDAEKIPYQIIERTSSKILENLGTFASVAKDLGFFSGVESKIQVLSIDSRDPRVQKFLGEQSLPSSVSLSVFRK